MFRRSDDKLLQELQGLGERLAEDRLYEVVLQELENEDYDPVAKAKALEEAEGDKEKSRAYYIRHRVRRIKDLMAELQLKAAADKLEEEQRKKQEYEKAKIKNALKKNLGNGKMPPSEIQKSYSREFSDFYEKWIEQDIARKYLSKAEAWRQFLSWKQII